MAEPEAGAGGAAALGSEEMQQQVVLLHHKRLAVRLEALARAVDLVKEGGDDVAVGLPEALAGPFYGERVWQAAIRDAIFACSVSSSAFSCKIAEGIQRLAPYTTAGAQIVAMKSLIAAMRGILEREGSSGALPESLLSAIPSVLSFRGPLPSPGASLLATFSRSCPALIPPLTKLTGCGEEGREVEEAQLPVIYVVGLAAGASQDPVIISLLLDNYIKTVLEKRGGAMGLTPLVLTAYGPVLSAIDQDTFESAVLPTLERLLKKSADSIAPAVLAALQQVRVDLSASSMSIFWPPLLRQLRSAKDDLRECAVSTVEQLALRTSSSAVRIDIVSALLSLLLGKSGGVLAQWYQRDAVLRALCSILDAQAPAGGWGQAEDVAAAQEILGSLSQFAEKESHEPTKQLGLQCLSKAVVVMSPLPCSSSLPEATIKCLVKCAQLPAATVAVSALEAALYVASHISDEDTISRLAKELGPAQLKRISEASARSSFNPAAAAALHFVLKARLLSGSKVFAEPVNAIGTLAFACPPAPKGVADGEVSCLIVACHALALAAVGAAEERAIFEKNSKAGHIWSALMGCLLHRDRHVFAAAREAVQSIMQVNPASRYGLLIALQGSLKLMSAYIESLDPESDTGRGAAMAATRMAAPALLATIDCPCADGGTEFGIPVVVPLVLLLSHHPLVSPTSRAATMLWQKLALSFFLAVEGDPEDDDAPWNFLTVRPSAGMQCAQAAVEAALDADVHLWVESGRRALVALAGCSGQTGCRLLVEQAMPSLLDRLRVELASIAELSRDEVGIYCTPETEVYRTGGNKRDAAAVSKNAARRGKDVEELEWEERMKKELMSKRGGSTGGDGAEGEPLSEDDKKLLREQAKVRIRVASLKSRVEAILKALACVFHVDGSSEGSRIGGRFIARSMTALSLDIMCQACTSTVPGVRDEAISGLRALCMAADDVIRPMAPLVADCHATLTAGPKSQLGGLLKSFTEEIGRRLRVGPEDMPSDALHLGLPSLYLVFPILLKVLGGHDDGVDTSTSHAEVALRVLATHARVTLSPADPLRVTMLEMALRATVRLRRAQPPADRVLATLCSNSQITGRQWELLTGEEGLLSPEAHVRRACLQAVAAMANEDHDLSVISAPLLEARLWLCRSDSDTTVAAAADDCWEVRDEELTISSVSSLAGLLEHKDRHVRDSASKALSTSLLLHPDMEPEVVETLRNMYTAALPQKKESGTASAFFIAEEEEVVDVNWGARSGVAGALEACANSRALLCSSDAERSRLLAIFDFIVERGLADEDPAVRGRMLSAGTALVQAYGKDVSFLEPCEMAMQSLSESEKSTSGKPTVGDWQREGVVVFLGAAARHLDSSDPKLSSIVSILRLALATPSEAVQRAVADSLAILCRTPVMKAEGSELISSLLNQCTKGETYGERRGGAYGLAAVIKGLGISSLKKEGVMTKLEEAAGSSANVPYQSKQGALCALECLCDRLGLLFEPYVIVLLPLLLRCFSDSSDRVREAAQECARVIMSNLSAHGVKLVLPAILKSLSDSAWRTKQAAIQLLGSMAYCAPKQLSSCLPMIVPKLTDAFSNTHPKVKEAGSKALEDIGSVIRNPEVAGLSRVLMAALSDAQRTKEAIEALLSCEFMHSIDAPSLALLMPVLQRGLKDRSADAKRKSALIVGNMCTMAADSKDLVPYLDAILPGLKSTVMDPIPDVRATSAKALGMLVEGMGEAALGGNLVPWLMDALREDSSSSERSGAAQGLAEVVLALGPLRARQTVEQDVIPLVSHPRPAAREGALWVLCFLPAPMGSNFTPIIPAALTAVLSGLSDEVDMVREVALRAGQVLVSAHGRTNAQQLLPALEAGLFNDNWRIRQASVQLLGDLLYLIGETKQVTLEEGLSGDGDEGAHGSSSASAAIEAALGKDRRNALLASLYLSRSDTSAVVRQSALQVWKTVVPQTPRALREILPLLMKQIVAALGSGNADKRAVAGRALGDVSHKMGDTVLPAMVPFLRSGLESDDIAMRQGVCVGLAEMMNSASQRQVEEFLDVLAPAVQQALCDSSIEVREEAAMAFQAMSKVVGPRAIHEVVPSLLKALAAGDEEEVTVAVFGLKEVLRLRPRELLPYLLPKLLALPISTAHARALSAVAQVTGHSVHMHLKQILPAIVGQLAEAEELEPDSARLLALRDCGASLVTSVEDIGANWLCTELADLSAIKEAAVEPPSRVFRYRSSAIWLIGQFVKATHTDFDIQVPMLLKALMQRLSDEDSGELLTVLEATRALNARCGPEKLSQHLGFCRGVLTSVIRESRPRLQDSEGIVLLPGLNITKGLEPWLPLYQHALMHGGADIRESAAAGIGELVNLTSAKALQPMLIKLTGPLIRIAGDRIPGTVKAAILRTLGLLLAKGGVGLKPFVPQLQTTFIKALSDPSTQARDCAASAMRQLMPLSTRVDPLVSELLSSASAAADASITAAILAALNHVLAVAGSRVSAAALGSCADSLDKLLASSNYHARAAAASAMGLTIKLLPEEESASEARAHLLGALPADAGQDVLHGRALALGALCHEVPSVAAGDLAGPVLKMLKAGVEGLHASSSSETKAAYLKSLGQLLAAASSQGGGGAEPVALALSQLIPSCLQDSSAEVRKAAALCAKNVGKQCPGVIRDHLIELVPPLLTTVKETNVAVKIASERALLHLLEIHTRPETLTDYVNGADVESARFIRDYSRRVLAKIAAESDGEDN